MTQAFNLAQFANFLNSSGQVSGSGLQSGLATQWTTVGSSVYYATGSVLIGGSTPTSSQLTVYRDVANSAIEEIARLSRIGGTSLYGNTREGALVFWDENNGTLVGAVAGVRESPSGNYNGGMALYVNNTGASPAGAVTSLTKAFALSSGSVMSFNSGYGSVAPAYGCRAWVNFNGTGTVAIRASANISTVSDLGTGSYRCNFSNAMPDANYSGQVASPNGSNGTWITYMVLGAQLTTSVAVNDSPSAGGGGGSVDHAVVCVAVFR